MTRYSIVRYFLIFTFCFKSIIFASGDGNVPITPRASEVIQGIKTTHEKDGSPKQMKRNTTLKTCTLLDGYIGSHEGGIKALVAKELGRKVSSIDSMLSRHHKKDRESASREASQSQYKKDRESASREASQSQSEVGIGEEPFEATKNTNFPTGEEVPFKSVYDFSFISSNDNMTLTKEHKISRALTQNHAFLEKEMLLEYISAEMQLESKHRLDFLFYSSTLSRYIIAELKVSNCDPSHFGQLSFYISAINEIQQKNPELKKRSTTGSPIGVLLYKSNATIDPDVVRLSLEGMKHHIAVSKFKLEKEVLLQKDRGK